MPINLETIPRPTPISVLSKMHAHFSYRWSHIGVVIFFDGKLILSGGDLNEAIGQCYQQTTYAFIEETKRDCHVVWACTQVQHSL